MPQPFSSVILAYAHYEEHLHSLTRIVAKLCSKLAAHRVLVVTTLDPGIVLASFVRRDFAGSTVEVLQHDNRDWEFGGYQRGVDALRLHWIASDTLIILNDTVGRHSVLTNDMLINFVAGIEQAAAKSAPTIVGEVDSEAADSSLYEHDASRWVRSCFLAINTAALDSLDWKINCPEIAEGIHVENGVGLAFPSHVSEGLGNSINRWLFTGRPGARWYRASSAEAPAVKESFFVQKALSILNERNLSARVLSTGGHAINIFPSRFFGYAAYRLNRKWNSVRRKWFS